MMRRKLLTCLFAVLSVGPAGIATAQRIPSHGTDFEQLLAMVRAAVDAKQPERAARLAFLARSRILVRANRSAEEAMLRAFDDVEADAVKRAERYVEVLGGDTNAFALPAFDVAIDKIAAPLKEQADTLIAERRASARRRSRRCAGSPEPTWSASRRPRSRRSSTGRPGTSSSSGRAIFPLAPKRFWETTDEARPALEPVRAALSKRTIADVFKGAKKGLANKGWKVGADRIDFPPSKTKKPGLLVTKWTSASPIVADDPLASWPIAFERHGNVVWMVISDFGWNVVDAKIDLGGAFGFCLLATAEPTRPMHLVALDFERLPPL
jgi:hypothetical protein